MFYSISKRLVPEDKSEVKIKIPEGTYTSYKFNITMKNALKEKGNHWILTEIKDYKLIISEELYIYCLKSFLRYSWNKPQNINLHFLKINIKQS